MGFSITSNLTGIAMNAEHSTCLICNSQFKTKKSKSNKYCGMACYRTAQKRGDYIKTRAKPKGKCLCCEADVYGSFSKNRDGTKCADIFCNRSCYDNYRAKIKENNLKSCACCGEKLGFKYHHNYKTKYCSKACKDEYKKSKDRHCISCGVWFSSLKMHYSSGKLVADNARKTCSHDCYIENIKTDKERKEKISKAFTGSKHPNWLGGSSYLDFGGFRGSNWQQIRRKVIERDGFKCLHCGIGRDEHKEKYKCDFNVNHKVPFHQFGGKTELANRLSNLETLCKSCHTKADWKYRKENQMQNVFHF